MPDLTIRGVSEQAAQAARQHAAAAGESREGFLRAVIEALAAAPLVRHAYALFALGPASAFAHVARQRNGEVTTTANALTEPQRTALARAVELVHRNAPGDREHAIVALGGAFGGVFEVPLVAAEEGGNPES